LSAPARESVPPADHSFSRAGADNEVARDCCSRSESLRLATRGSALALWQAHHVRDLLRRAHPTLAVELVLVRTAGDRDRNTPLDKAGGTGLFTKEVQAEVLAGRADVAVHSLKDLPTATVPGLALAAVPAREDPRDALVGRPGRVTGLEDLGPGVVLGTSSPRRRGQLLAARPGLSVVPLRGNVPTRVESVTKEGGPDATVLALAGLTRLGLLDRVTEVLPLSVMLPAPGQGALGIEARADDRRALALLAVLDDAGVRTAVAAERAFLRRLEGGCSVPAGALATAAGPGRLRLSAVVADPGGGEVFRLCFEGAAADPEALGVRLADALVAAGAGPLLRRLREAE
jgi:hydroxymethylbilane synthase